MNLLTDAQMHEVSGGGMTRAMIAGFIAAGIFVVGVIDGFIRPLKCNR